MEYDGSIGEGNGGPAQPTAPAAVDLSLGLEQMRVSDGSGAGSDKTKQLDDKQLQLKQLLEPLDKDKLKSIVLQLAANDSALAEQCITMAAEDLSNRKLFVRGLAWATTDEGLKQAFSEYGEIAEGGIAVDRMTGKSRGFGFVTFQTASAAQAALREPNKVIDGRQTTCNLASAGVQQRGAGGGGRGHAMGSYGGGRGGGGYGRGGGVPISPRMPNNMPNVAVSAMPTSYERYLSSIYSNYAPPMMPPPSGYENMGR